ncbi:MAG: FAD-dependent oxidoreductase [Deltaproteobacteria bacterium]|nr:FAD-dependent oxidoreductase [Deltaproteobacteria bacterium]
MSLRQPRVRTLLSVLALALTLGAPSVSAIERFNLNDCSHLINARDAIDLDGVPHASSEKAPPLPKEAAERPAYAKFLKDRYGVEEAELTWGKTYPLLIRGGGERSFHPDFDATKAEPDPGEYDAVIIGSGPAGLTAGVYLSDAGQRVLILERDKSVGGLGQGGEHKGTHYGRGAAYIAEIEGLTAKIYKHLGIGDYKRDYPIPEPIDSFYWNGKYYEGLWENPKAMEELPQSFALFKFYLEHVTKEGHITSQPLELQDGTFDLDSMSMAEWVRRFPTEMAKLAETDADAKQVYDRFIADSKVNKGDPMKDVLGLLDLYGRSALGDHTDMISAAGFGNFYSSELGTRYTGNMGSGTMTGIIHKKLEGRSDLVTIKTEAPAAKVVTRGDGGDVYYVKDGKTYKVSAQKIVFAASLNVAARIIEGFEQQAPEQLKAIESLKFRHYLVINAHVKGHPWKKTYDLWVRDDGSYSQAETTDIIDGRWMDFQGKDGARTDDRGVLTIYLPLPEAAVHEKLTDEKAAELAERAVKKAIETLGPLAEKYDDGQQIKPLLVEVNRWLYSIHVVEPGHFKKALLLKKPLGNIHFADNNIGLPSIEEAVYRGYEAAQGALQGMKNPVRKKPKRRKKTAATPQQNSTSVRNLVSVTR